jgi:hypothetical protein
MPLRLSPALLAISLFSVVSPVAAQSNPPALGPLACGALYVGGEINNPFTARRITSTMGRSATDPRMPEILEIVARDSAGRVRIEKHPGTAGQNGSDPVVLHTRDGGQINTTHAELNTLTMIFDCFDGKMITLQPGMKIAHLRAGRAMQPSLQAEHPYSFFFTSSLRHNPTADVFAEDLGHKTIEGIDALGVKTTQIGSEEDEWKGKPIRILEKWVSDELAAMLVETVIDLKKDMETTSRLTDVSRVEPDASLFEIPAGYNQSNACRDAVPGWRWEVGRGSAKTLTQVLGSTFRRLDSRPAAVNGAWQTDMKIDAISS